MFSRRNIPIFVLRVAESPLLSARLQSYFSIKLCGKHGLIFDIYRAGNTMENDEQDGCSRNKATELSFGQ